MVGDLESKRDWTDVRDMVRAYWLALEKGVPGEVYNVGSGTTQRVGDMLDLLLSLSTAKIEVRQDPARLRPSDVKILWADASKFRARTGWEPTIPFRTDHERPAGLLARARVANRQGFRLAERRQCPFVALTAFSVLMSKGARSPGKGRRP